MLPDFSQKADLRPLALVVSALQSVDMAAFLDRAARARLHGILAPEANTAGPLLLAKQSGLDLERARRLIEALCDELTDAIDTPTK